MVSKYIKTSRGKFHVVENENFDGFPLVLIHGWPQSHFCWKRIIPYIEGDWRIITPDLRGLGDSERSLEQDKYRKVELARDMLELLNELKVQDCIIVGHDWGGAVTQEMAVLEPNRIKKMVLINISVINNLKGNLEAQQKLNSMGNYVSWYQHFQQQKHLPEAMIKGNEAVWLGYILYSFSGIGFPKDAMQEYIRCYQKDHTPCTGANYYRTFRDDIQRWMELSGLVFKMPSLYIHGTKDMVIIPEFLNHIETCFADIRVKEVDSGHFVMEEQPEEVAKHLNDFL